MRRHTALDARHHLILDADIGERAARHHAIVAATRAVAVEVLRLDAVLDQITAGGRIFLYPAGGAYVVGRDAVAANRPRPRICGFGRFSRPPSRTGGERRAPSGGGLPIPP